MTKAQESAARALCWRYIDADPHVDGFTLTAALGMLHLTRRDLAELAVGLGPRDSEEPEQGERRLRVGDLLHALSKLAPTTVG